MATTKANKKNQEKSKISKITKKNSKTINLKKIAYLICLNL